MATSPSRSTPRAPLARPTAPPFTCRRPSTDLPVSLTTTGTTKHPPSTLGFPSPASMFDKARACTRPSRAMGLTRLTFEFKERNCKHTKRRIHTQKSRAAGPSPYFAAAACCCCICCCIAIRWRSTSVTTKTCTRSFVSVFSLALLLRSPCRFFCFSTMIPSTFLELAWTDSCKHKAD